MPSRPSPLAPCVARGCLLGGAVGDALGAAIEFLSLEEIRARFGHDGVTDLVPAWGRLGAITDDTQMTLFTAEGLLRATTRWSARGICHVPTMLHHAYLRWLHTQGFTSAGALQPPLDGWLWSVPALHARRAPGRTCVTSLESGRMGTVEEPLNHSKGCGGVMRVAPVGLAAVEPFRLACDAAAITHGHPSGYLAAGALALIITLLRTGRDLVFAVQAALDELTHHAGHEESSLALLRALETARTMPPAAETVESLGQGWVAEQALAIAVYCALAAEDDFARGVLLAVNHSGDSDSTGAIAGNILGTLLGEAAIPPHWLDALELRAEITALADDLVTGYRDDEAWFERYPGG